MKLCHELSGILAGVARGSLSSTPRRAAFPPHRAFDGGASILEGVACIVTKASSDYLGCGAARTRPAGRAAGPDRRPCATKSRPPLPSRREGATLWQSRGEVPLSAGHRTHRKARDICATRAGYRISGLRWSLYIQRKSSISYGSRTASSFGKARGPSESARQSRPRALAPLRVPLCK